MWLIRASKVSTDALGQLARRQQTSRFDHSPFAMHPFGFDRIEPGTLFGQHQRQNAHALTRLLDLLVVRSDPGAHHLAHMPGRMIPDQEPVALALCLQTPATPVQKLQGDGAFWTTGDKAQPHPLAHRLLLRALLPQDAITGQSGCRSGSPFFHACSTRWKGCCWLCQACIRGRAKRLHHT
jgi:hypothetical protein